MNEPAVVLLDEPSARLDLGGREQLVQALAELTTDPSAPPLILVTHHLDEVPPGMTHVLMLREGKVVVSGPIGARLTSANLSDCFGLPLTLERPRRRPVQCVVATSCSRRSRPDVICSASTRSERAAGPQRTAVVQVHGQRADAVVLDDRARRAPRASGCGRRPDRARTRR